MAYYSISVDTVPTQVLGTVQPGASTGLAISDFFISWTDSAFASRNDLYRGTGGVTPTAATPEKFNSRSSAPSGTFNSDWATGPTKSGLTLISLPFYTDGASVGIHRWMPPKPQYPPYENSGGNIFVLLSASGGVDITRYIAFVADRPGPSVRIGPLRGRRNREPGIYFIQDASRHFDTTSQPFNRVGGWAYSYIQPADWDLVVDYNQCIFLNLLSGADGSATVGSQFIGTSTLSGKPSTALLVKNQLVGTSTLSGIGKGQAKSLNATLIGTSTLSGKSKTSATLKNQLIGTSTLSGKSLTSATLKNQFIGTSTLSGLGKGQAKSLNAILIGTSTFSGKSVGASLAKNQLTSVSTLSGKSLTAFLTKNQLIGTSALSGLGKGQALVGRQLTAVSTLSGSVSVGGPALVTSQFIGVSTLTGKGLGSALAKNQFVATSAVSGKALGQSIIKNQLVATSTLSGRTTTAARVANQLTSVAILSGRFSTPTSTVVTAQFILLSTITGTAYRNEAPPVGVSGGAGGGPPIKIQQPPYPFKREPELVVVPAFECKSNLSARVKLGLKTDYLGRAFIIKSVISAKVIVKATRSEQVRVKIHDVPATWMLIAKGSSKVGASLVAQTKLDSKVIALSDDEIVLAAYDLLVG